ncbi:hypothetical protein DW083_11660 [Parabacteroides sp. AF48-14]|nr:hypothetical protein DW083_11660 [Parabacteroides sp. AF48-14]
MFPVFGNQIAHFPERAAHLVFPIVRKQSLNREKSQFKIDQDFGRNRKTDEKRVIVISIPALDAGSQRNRRYHNPQQSRQALFPA